VRGKKERVPESKKREEAPEKKRPLSRKESSPEGETREFSRLACSDAAGKKRFAVDKGRKRPGAAEKDREGRDPREERRREPFY